MKAEEESSTSSQQLEYIQQQEKQAQSQLSSPKNFFSLEDKYGYNRMVIVKNFKDKNQIENLRTKITKSTLPNFELADECSQLNIHLKCVLRFLLKRKLLVVEFCNLAISVYQDRNDQVKEFREDMEKAQYKQLDDKKILSLYQKQSFFYKLVNNILRLSKNITVLSYTQPFLKDNFKAIYKNYKKRALPLELTVYRGASMSQQQLQMLKGNLEKLIQSQGFMSTSMDRQKAKKFMVNVLIIIKIPTNISSSHYKNLIGDYGYCFVNELLPENQYQNEQEVLFNIFSIFKITGFKLIIDEGYYEIQMTYINSLQELYKRFHSKKLQMVENQEKIDQIKDKYYKKMEPKPIPPAEHKHQVTLIIDEGAIIQEQPQRINLFIYLLKMLATRISNHENQPRYPKFVKWFQRQTKLILRQNKKNPSQIFLVFKNIAQILRELAQKFEKNHKMFQLEDRLRMKRLFVVQVHFLFVELLKLGEKEGLLEGNQELLGSYQIIYHQLVNFLMGDHYLRLANKQFQWYHNKTNKYLSKFPKLLEKQQKVKNLKKNKNQKPCSDIRLEITNLNSRCFQSEFLAKTSHKQMRIIYEISKQFIHKKTMKPEQQNFNTRLLYENFQKGHEFLYLYHLEKFRRDLEIEKGRLAMRYCEKYLKGNPELEKFKDIKNQVEKLIKICQDRVKNKNKPNKKKVAAMSAMFKSKKAMADFNKECQQEQYQAEAELNGKIDFSDYFKNEEYYEDEDVDEDVDEYEDNHEY